MSPSTDDQVWNCSVCSAEHRGLAMVFGPNGPDSWAAAGESDRAKGEINRDTCVLPTPDGTYFFIRGEIRVPVIDAGVGDFAWSVWASLSERNMMLQAKHLGRPGPGPSGADVRVAQHMVGSI
jgi:hypothetical protein